MSSLEAITSLECSIVVPDGADVESKSAGRVIDLDRDRRRFPRFTCKVDAAMQYQPSLPAIQRSSGWMRVLVRNVSRCGIGFWHGEAMYPLEQALIVLPNGVQRILEVRRCRRVGPSCFEIGGEFSELLEDPRQISELR